MDPRWIELVANVGFPLTLLLFTWFTGAAVERSHYRSIRVRETRSRRMPVMNVRRVPAGWTVAEAGLVTGHVVVSVDYFKRFLAVLRVFVGGRIRSYESLLDRARREALLRMKEAAVERGAQAVVGVRLETSRIANGRGRRDGLAGVEILAFGTALRLVK